MLSTRAAALPVSLSYHDPVKCAGLGSLSVLPDSILSLLCFYLDTRSLCCLACCSKLLRVYAYEEPVWQHQALDGHDGPVQYKANWRQTALSLLHQAALAAKPADISSTNSSNSSSSSSRTGCTRLQQLSSTWRQQQPQQLNPRQQFQVLPRSSCTAAGAAAMHPVGVPAASRSSATCQPSTLNPSLFLERYDMPAQPVILTGYMDDEWPAGWQQHWQLDSLAAAYGSSLLRASKPSGGKAALRLADYAAYMAQQADEEPLYVFDGDLQPRRLACATGTRRRASYTQTSLQCYVSLLWLLSCAWDVPS
ncbi:hypothetical protein COO60DRAFT_32754 [Scenedesmus sp. NREL 46B-D3]|nr:hypothetical protein COO60DRAFT_32754 [Scenedesmus sp. NREL 46B-D3]